MAKASRSHRPSQKAPFITEREMLPFQIEKALGNRIVQILPKLFKKKAKKTKKES